MFGHLPQRNAENRASGCVFWRCRQGSLVEVGTLFWSKPAGHSGDPGMALLSTLLISSFDGFVVKLLTLGGGLA